MVRGQVRAHLWELSLELMRPCRQNMIPPKAFPPSWKDWTWKWPKMELDSNQTQIQQWRCEASGAQARCWSCGLSQELVCHLSSSLHLWISVKPMMGTILSIRVHSPLSFGIGRSRVWYGRLRWDGV